jgi:predicted flap endonuclease-1-like 5' DNA nuclease
VAWSIGHSLIVVLALLLGFGAGWLLRGRQGVAGSGRGSSIVDGDPVAGLAVVSTPEAAATTDPARPAATVDPTPGAVADEPTPVDTVTAPATVTAGTTLDDLPRAEARSTVDPADMALTDGPADEPAATPSVISPRPAPEAERVTDTGTTPSAAGSTDTATGSSSGDLEPTAPAEIAPATDTPAQPTATEAAPLADAPAHEPAADAAVTDEPAAEPATARDEPAAEPAPARDEPVDVPADEPAPATAATVVDEPADAAVAPTRPGVATPPVRPTATATPPVRPAGATVPATADSDADAPADDFRRIQGIGPKLAAALQAAGVRTYRQLGELDEPALRDLVRAAGLRAAPGLASWPQQARVLAGAGDEMAAVLPGGAES